MLHHFKELGCNISKRCITCLVIWINFLTTFDLRAKSKENVFNRTSEAYIQNL